MKVGKGRPCAAMTCRNNSRASPKLSFFRFPKDHERCKRWVINCQREDFKRKSVESLARNHSICAKHFEDCMFMNAQQRNRLVHDAIPWLFDNITKPTTIEKKRPPDGHPLPLNKPLEAANTAAIQLDHMYYSLTSKPRCEIEGSKPTSDSIGMVKRNHTVTFTSDQRCVSTQTELRTTCEKMTSIERPFKTSEVLNLRRKLHSQRVKTSRLQKKFDHLKKQLDEASKSYEIPDLIRGMERHLSGTRLAFFASQLQMPHRQAQGHRWSEEVVKMAVSVYKAGPKAYEELGRDFLLPSVKAVRRVLTSEMAPVTSDTETVIESKLTEENIALKSEIDV